MELFDSSFKQLCEDHDSFYENLDNARLQRLGQEGDFDALHEIENRGFDIETFLNRPLSEFF